MKIVVLDGYTENSWRFKLGRIKELGEVEVYGTELLMKSHH